MLYNALHSNFEFFKHIWQIFANYLIIDVYYIVLNFCSNQCSTINVIYI
jgi:hypothetical protein